MRRSILIAFLSLASVVAVSGCGDAGTARPTLVPVTGKVIRNGKPVAKASVAFISPKASRNAIGETDADGKFQLGTFGNTDGAIVGNHVVIVSKTSAAAATPVPSSPEEMTKMVAAGKMVAPKLDESIPAQYADPKLTRLKATVKGDGQDNFEFDLLDY